MFVCGWLLIEGKIQILQNINLHLKKQEIRENIITLSDAALCVPIVSINETYQNTKRLQCIGTGIQESCFIIIVLTKKALISRVITTT